VRVRGDFAAAGELNAESFGAKFHVGWGAIGRGHAAARLAFRRSGGVQEIGSPLDFDVVVLLEPFDLNEADVAPGSDEVGDDEEGGVVGGDLVFGHRPSIERLRRRAVTLRIRAGRAGG
jgi:hypothetical protein